MNEEKNYYYFYLEIGMKFFFVEISTRHYMDIYFRDNFAKGSPV